MTPSRRIDHPLDKTASAELPLSRRLRAETKDLHTAAERSGVMRRIVRGRVSRREYVALLQNLAEIYRALEDGLRQHRRHAALCWLDLDALARLGRIEQDIATLHRTDDAADAIQPATRAYVERIRDATATQPELLLAHAYVRYLGDLSGGQMLAPIVSRTFGSDGPQAVAFYQFPLIPDAAAFKQRFRDALDRSATGVLSDRVVAEAKTAFVLHEALFKELEQN